MNPSELEVIELKFKRFALQQVVDEEVFASVDASLERALYGGVAMQLAMHVLTDDLPPEHVAQRKMVYHDWPHTAWQMWKRDHRTRWYARWLVKRWPVTYSSVGKHVTCEFDLERFRGYPQAQVRVDDSRFGRAVRFHQITNLNWRTDEDPA